MISPKTSWRAAIAPVHPCSGRPRWSVMIPTYRSAAYIAQALRSILDQDPGPGAMQLEVVDDASDDETEAIVRAIGGDRVNFYAQPSNVGHIANFQTCLERARGEIVHLLHGDDFVLPGFYAALDHGFGADPLVGAAYCRAIYVGEDGAEKGRTQTEEPTPGILADALQRLATEQRIMTPSIAVRRSVYEKLGGFDRRLACAEDWEMWVRVAAHYRIWYEPEALACYRVHSDSNTGRHVQSALDSAFNLVAIRMFEPYLPVDEAPALVARARRTYSRSALLTARDLLADGDVRGFLAQARAALRLSPSILTGVDVLRAAYRAWGSRARGY